MLRGIPGLHPKDSRSNPLPELLSAMSLVHRMMPGTWLMLTGKDSDAGRDWGQEEKGMTEDEMAGWHH